MVLINSGLMLGGMFYIEDAWQVLEFEPELEAWGEATR